MPLPFALLREAAGTLRAPELFASVPVWSPGFLPEIGAGLVALLGAVQLLVPLL